MFKNNQDEISRVSHGIQHCQRCERAGTRTVAVPGEGSPEARMLLLGEAAGRQEDRSGRPFVGRAGAYLDKMFRLHSLDRDTVFITSILKCYHPDSPKKAQIETCRSWTEVQIELLQPELILVMGKTAERGLFGKAIAGKEPIIVWEGISCVVTCHPAAAMRFPQMQERFKLDFERFVRLAEVRELL